MVLITQAPSEISGAPAHSSLRLKNAFTEDEKYHNLMRWLSYEDSIAQSFGIIAFFIVVHEQTE